MSSENDLINIYVNRLNSELTAKIKDGILMQSHLELSNNKIQELEKKLEEYALNDSSKNESDNTVINSLNEEISRLNNELAIKTTDYNILLNNFNNTVAQHQTQLEDAKQELLKSLVEVENMTEENMQLQHIINHMNKEKTISGMAKKIDDSISSASKASKIKKKTTKPKDDF